MTRQPGKFIYEWMRLLMTEKSVYLLILVPLLGNRTAYAYNIYIYISCKVYKRNTICTLL